MKNAFRKNVSTLSIAAAALMLLAGCDMFSNDVDTHLPGERISVLQLQKELVPNPDLQQQAVNLPEAWTNQFWPQAGGYSTHAMGHLALGKNLKMAWRESIGVGGNRRSPLTSGPVVAEGIVFTLDTEGQVTAFDLQTGRKKWRQSAVPEGEEDTSAVGGGLAYASGRLFVTNGYKFVTALDPQKGSLLWKAATPAPTRAAPSVMDDKVYAMTLDNRLLVFNTSDGTPVWNFSGVSEETNLLGSASPAVDQSVVVLPLSSGELFGLRPENGQVVWQDNLSSVRRAGALSSLTDIRGLPVIDQGIVYAVSYSGRMVAMDPVSGERVWQREIGSAETPWAAGDTVYVISTEQQLAALTRAAGDIRWVQQLSRFADKDKKEPVVWTGPVLAGNRLFVASSEGEVMSVDPQTGKPVESLKAGGSVTIAPVVAGNTLLVLTEDGELSAWR